MKKLLLLIILIFSVSSTALAFQNEPSGFRGLSWGSSVKALLARYPDAGKIDPEDGEIADCFTGYDVTLPNDSISGVPLTEPVSYWYANNKLMEVSVDLSGESDAKSLDNAKSMRNALRTLYGPWSKSFISYYSDTFIWQGPVTKISFTVLYKTRDKTEVKESTLRLESEKVSAEYVKFLKEHQQKKAKQGW